ncbi:ribonuclease H-like domain-containing protein [Tanacetum coccineum]|uniref:Ribonuclease H-like domain-containing protein n=1 Tax=Tanacetum coccineum TaxID=301880 RepID=A0ABQ4WUK0_9ASTR
MPTPTQSPTTQNEHVAQSPIIIADPPENPNPVSVHPMVTCYRVGTNRPIERLNLHVSSVFPLSKSYHDAFSDPNWQNAMRDEYHALIKNKTWTLVPRPPDTNIVRFYMHQPPGFQDSVHPYYVYLLQRSLYGLKQALELGFSVLHLILLGLDSLIVDVTPPYLSTNRGSILLTCYYMLMILFSPLLLRFWLFLSQKKYAVEILDRAHMVNCNPSRTPIDTESKLRCDGDSISDLTLYRSLAGSLQYLDFTRPDISYALFSSSSTDLVAYSDVDWAGCPTTRRSTSGYYVFLGNNLLSWSSKRLNLLPSR